MTNLQKSLVFRFLRGALAGAISSMITINANVNTFEDLTMFVKALTISGIIGFITGGMLTIDKYLRSE